MRSPPPALGLPWKAAPGSLSDVVTDPATGAFGRIPRGCPELRR